MSYYTTYRTARSKPRLSMQRDKPGAAEHNKMQPCTYMLFEARENRLDLGGGEKTNNRTLVTRTGSPGMSKVKYQDLKCDATPRQGHKQDASTTPATISLLPYYFLPLLHETT